MVCSTTFSGYFLVMLQEIRVVGAIKPLLTRFARSVLNLTVSAPVGCRIYAYSKYRPTSSAR